MSRRRINKKERTEIAKRAGFKCEYCLILDDYTNHPFVGEHIHPFSKGGLTELNNLAYACGGCNGHKYERTEFNDPETNQVVPLFHPRKDSWAEHFEWSEDKLKIIGKTPIGRATVLALKMIRDGLINLRTLLISAKLHPPK